MSESANNADPSGFSDLDRLLHEPSRISIMALLYMVDSADFIFVMNQIGLTWGNLSSHMSKLEEAGYLEIKKGYKGKRPHTDIRLTPSGRASFKEYVLKVRNLFKNLPV
jgi:DNA-binding MarR family transcriptional regulator